MAQPNTQVTTQPWQVRLYLSDCLVGMSRVETGSVDLILCDLPYGTTACRWDTVIPFTPLWEQYRRVLKPRGALVLMAAQPFATDLINSARKLFRYDLIWEKNAPVGYATIVRRWLIKTNGGEARCIRDGKALIPEDVGLVL